MLTTAGIYKKFISMSDSDTTLDDFLAIVVPEVDRALRTELNLLVIEQVSGIVEYIDGNGLDSIYTRAVPLQSIQEVREDIYGAWGQNVTIQTATLTSGSATITGLTAATTTLSAGMPVSGTGIPALTTISSVTSDSTLILSANATVSGAQSLTFTTGFSNSTILVQGQDYAMRPDDPITGWSRRGQIVRLNGYWASQQQRAFERLARKRIDAFGAVKVTYTAGLSTDPNIAPLDLQLAANLLISQIKLSRLYGFLTTSEGLAEYHYQLGQLLHGFMQIGTVQAIVGKYKEVPV